MDNYNYPLGADTSDAPWNAPSPILADFECTISELVTRKVKIEDVELYCDPEDVDGLELNDELNNDYNKYHHNIQKLIELLCKYVDDELNTLPKDGEHRQRRRYLESVLSDCQQCEILESDIDDYELI